MQSIIFPVSDEKIRVLSLGLPLSVELNTDDVAEIAAYWLCESTSLIFDLKKDLEKTEDPILLSIAGKLPLGVICTETNLVTLMTDRIYISQP